MASDDLYLHLEHASLTGLAAVHADALIRRPWKLIQCDDPGEWIVDDELPEAFLRDTEAALLAVGLSPLDVESRLRQVGFTERTLPIGAEVRFRTGYLYFRKEIEE